VSSISRSSGVRCSATWGRNGAGKTTTIRLLLDFIRPTSGRVEVLGGTGADPAVRRRIGYPPAELPIDPRWTAQDLIGFYGPLRGGVDAGWVTELLGRFDLDPTRRVGELSTGNRRKIGIVQAVIHRPDLLILDEPSSGLDPLLQYEFQRLVRELAGAGTTVFLSSHVLPEVEALAGRVASASATPTSPSPWTPTVRWGDRGDSNPRPSGPQPPERGPGPS
jgi:beta-exotoxin I transport system ATP-binding protein